MRQAVDELHQAGRLGYGVWGAGVLVETLLERGAEGMRSALAAHDEVLRSAIETPSAS